MDKFVASIDAARQSLQLGFLYDVQQWQCLDELASQHDRFALAILLGSISGEHLASIQRGQMEASIAYLNEMSEENFWRYITQRRQGNHQG